MPMAEPATDLRPAREDAPADISTDAPEAAAPAAAPPPPPSAPGGERYIVVRDRYTIYLLRPAHS